jgi:hypothetical protein
VVRLPKAPLGQDRASRSIRTAWSENGGGAHGRRGPLVGVGGGAHGRRGPLVGVVCLGKHYCHEQPLAQGTSGQLTKKKKGASTTQLKLQLVEEEDEGTNVFSPKVGWGNRESLRLKQLRETPKDSVK